jgi:predicted small secreted protein
MKTSLKILLLLPILAIFLPSCQTAKGVGQDLERLGDGIERTANRID